MRRWGSIGLCMVVAIGLSGASVAGETKADTGSSLIAAMNEAADQQSGDAEAGAPAEAAVVVDTRLLQTLDHQYRETLLKARISQARFAIEATNMQIRMYRHHQFWTDAAAVMVYLLTSFGMLCAAVQFRLFARLRGPLHRGPETPDEKEESAGSVELPGGMKVNSPFLGVVILVISLAFFSLYLTEVYPIKASTGAPLVLSAP